MTILVGVYINNISYINQWIIPNDSARSSFWKSYQWLKVMSSLSQVCGWQDLDSRFEVEEESDVPLEGTVWGQPRFHLSHQPASLIRSVGCVWPSSCFKNAMSGIQMGWVEGSILGLLLHWAAVLCTPVSSCRSGVKCKGSMSDLRASFRIWFLPRSGRFVLLAVSSETSFQAGAKLADLIGFKHILLGYYVCLWKWRLGYQYLISWFNV